MSVLIQLATALVTWFTQWFTRRTAYIAAFLTLMAGFVAALFAAVNALIAGLGVSSAMAGSASVTLIYSWLRFLLPANAQLCLATLIAYHVVIRLFRFQTETARIAAIKF